MSLGEVIIKVMKFDGIAKGASVDYKERGVWTDSLTFRGKEEASKETIREEEGGSEEYGIKIQVYYGDFLEHPKLKQVGSGFLLHLFTVSNLTKKLEILYCCGTHRPMAYNLQFK